MVSQIWLPAPTMTRVANPIHHGQLGRSVTILVTTEAAAAAIPDIPTKTARNAVRFTIISQLHCGFPVKSSFHMMVLQLDGQVSVRRSVLGITYRRRSGPGGGRWGRGVAGFRRRGRRCAG